MIESLMDIQYRTQNVHKSPIDLEYSADNWLVGFPLP